MTAMLRSKRAPPPNPLVTADGGGGGAGVGARGGGVPGPGAPPQDSPTGLPSLAGSLRSLAVRRRAGVPARLVAARGGIGGGGVANGALGGGGRRRAALGGVGDASLSESLRAAAENLGRRGLRGPLGPAAAGGGGGAATSSVHGA